MKMQKKKAVPWKGKLTKLVRAAHSLGDDFGRPLTDDQILKSHGVNPRNPETYKEYVIDRFDEEFLMGGFLGFETGVRRVGELLKQYGIRAESKTGKHILKTYLEHVRDEKYGGGFENVFACEKCGQDFEPAYSLEYARDVLKGKAWCAACSKKRLDSSKSSHG